MNLKPALTFTLLSLSLVQGRAGDLTARKHSSFQVEEAAHNPFWPIGWTKAAPIQTVAAAPATAAIRAEHFALTSLLINNPPLAVINGREMALGETVMMTIENQQVPVQLVAVQDGRVVIVCRGQQIAVYLQRRGEMKTARN